MKTPEIEDSEEKLIWWHTSDSEDAIDHDDELKFLQYAEGIGSWHKSLSYLIFTLLNELTSILC